MKRLIITEEERSRILGMHQNAVKKESINENKKRNETSIDDFLRVAKKTLTSESFSKLKGLLMEADLVVPTLPNVDKAGLRAIPGFANAEQVTQKWVQARKTPFSVEEPIFWLTLYQLGKSAFGDNGVQWAKKGYSPKILQKQINEYKIDLVDRITSALAGNREYEVQLNEHPDQKGMVLTVGNITAAAYQPGDEAGASNIKDIATFCNDFNLKTIIVNPNGSSISIEPYKLQKGNITGSYAFVEGNPKTTPGAGALNISEALVGSGTILYATSTYKAAGAQTAGTTKTDIIYKAGPELEAKLPSQMFPTGKITIESGMEKYIDEAVAAAKTAAGEGGQITGARIESSASFDLPINTDQAGFAKMVGLDVTKVPKNPKVDQQGDVKDPMSGGNAFLAYNRGLALKNALGDKAGVVPTMVAKVQPGKEAAQYAKIFFTVKKPDQSTEITTQDVQSIGSGTKSTDLGGLFKLFVYDLP